METWGPGKNLEVLGCSDEEHEHLREETEGSGALDMDGVMLISLDPSPTEESSCLPSVPSRRTAATAL